MKEKDIQSLVLEVLRSYTAQQINLASEVAQAEISNHLAKKLVGAFEGEIESLKDENASLWQMLEEIKEADIKNYAGEFQEMLDRKMMEVKMLALTEPAEA
jgi:hypothetical protein